MTRDSSGFATLTISVQHAIKTMRIEDVLSTSMTLNDLEPPKKKFWASFRIFWAAAHTSRVNCDEVAEDRPRQPK